MPSSHPNPLPFYFIFIIIVYYYNRRLCLCGFSIHPFHTIVLTILYHTPPTHLTFPQNFSSSAFSPIRDNFLFLAFVESFKLNPNLQGRKHEFCTKITFFLKKYQSNMFLKIIFKLVLKIVIINYRFKIIIINYNLMETFKKKMY